MSNDILNEIELSISEAKKLVDLGNSLERLRNNVDFKKVIQSGYFEQEAIRLVHLRADNLFQTEDRQRMINKQMDSIGMLVQYFDTILFKARQAEKAIEVGEATRDEMLSEGVE